MLKPHSITIFAKTDTNLRRYNVSINERALYDGYGITVDEFMVHKETNSITILATYCINSIDLMSMHSTNKISKYNDTFSPHKYIVTIDNESISHIAVGKPLPNSDNVEIHYKDGENRIIDVTSNNNILSFISRKDIDLNISGLSNIIDLNIRFTIPDNYVLQICSSNNCIHTGVSVFNGPYNILDSDKVEICLKWIGGIKTLETNKYEVEKNVLNQITQIKIPAGVVIAQAIMIERKPIELSYY